MKTKIIAGCILGVLIILFGVLLFLQLQENKENKALYESSSVKIIIAGEEHELSFEELSALSTPVGFDAVYKPSNKSPITKTYTGIELRAVLEALGCDLDSINQVVFTAQDGLQKVYRASDVIKENNVYITYLVNGEPFNKGIDPMAYSKEQEDGGPYVIIKAEDQVSQNRVKLLVEISVE